VDGGSKYDEALIGLGGTPRPRSRLVPLFAAVGSGLIVLGLAADLGAYTAPGDARYPLATTGAAATGAGGAVLLAGEVIAEADTAGRRVALWRAMHGGEAASDTPEGRARPSMSPFATATPQSFTAGVAGSF